MEVLQTEGTAGKKTGGEKKKTQVTIGQLEGVMYGWSERMKEVVRRLLLLFSR